MSEIHKVKVTLEFRVAAKTYLDAMKEVETILKTLKDQQDDFFADETGEPQIVKYNIWAK